MGARIYLILNWYCLFLLAFYLIHCSLIPLNTTNHLFLPYRIFEGFMLCFILSIFYTSGSCSGQKCFKYQSQNSCLVFFMLFFNWHFCKTAFSTWTWHCQDKYLHKTSVVKQDVIFTHKLSAWTTRKSCSSEVGSILTQFLKQFRADRLHHFLPKSWKLRGEQAYK